MEEVTKEEIIEIVQNCIMARRKWHFHMLSPRCMFNGRAQHAFILENTTDEKTYVLYSVERQSDLGERLVKLLHGEDVTEKKENFEKALDEKEIKIIKKAISLNKKSKDWHHHVLFPDCLFNESKSKWRFIFEGESEGDVFEFDYSEEPNHLLSEIEPLFYTQKQ